MKVHTTNYSHTFIAVAEDCPALQGAIPPLNETARSVARLQYELLLKHPYRFTSDEVLFRVYAERNDLAAAELETARQAFFSKGQPCFRSSPLTKRYGWGVHFNEAGKMAIYGRETEMYEKLEADPQLKQVRAMRAKRG